jgi:cardiolipin synthase
MKNLLQDNIWGVLLVLNYILALALAIFILLKNKNPVRTLSYLFILAVLPFLGLLVYYLFGQDYRKSKIFEKKKVHDNERIKKFREKFSLNASEKESFEKKQGHKNGKIRRLLNHNQRSILTYDNDVYLLRNGEEKFKQLRKDLEAAVDHIHLEYFSIVDDDLGIDLVHLLCKKAQNGVKVRFIYDDVGTNLNAKLKRSMTKSGVEHYPFMPVLFSNSTGKLNYRNHKKIVVIDGKIGYVGGINLEKKYDNSYENKTYWRDTHLRLQGGAVGALQSSFLLSWSFVSKANIPEDDDLFVMEKQEIQHPVAIQIVDSGPDTDWPNIMEALFCAITGAENRIYITTPYFMPNNAMLTALTTACRGGADVRVIIPYESDSWIAQYATDSYIEESLLSGIKVYRYKKGFVHAKTLIVDDHFSSVGTANFDYRSFSINFEVNAILYNDRINTQLAQLFSNDLKECEEVILARWKKRGVFRRLQESLSRLMAPLL